MQKKKSRTKLYKGNLSMPYAHRADTRHLFRLKEMRLRFCIMPLEAQHHFVGNAVKSLCRVY